MAKISRVRNGEQEKGKVKESDQPGTRETYEEFIENE